MASKPSTGGLLLYGVRSIADFLGIRPRQALHLVEQDRIPHYRIGRVVCANRQTLTAWLAEQERATGRGGK